MGDNARGVGVLDLSIVDKAFVIRRIIEQLDGELSRYERSARAAHAEATDEQSKAENKYDTRGLEASYLARGQSKQFAEVLEAREQYAALPVRLFEPKDPVDIGALVEVEMDGEKEFYFIGPRAGGMEIVDDGRTVLVITPQSPLGQQLAGKRAGDRLQIRLGGRARKCRVISVE